MRARKDAVAAAPAAFLPRLDLARCYDLSWRLEDVGPAIADALSALRAESHPAAVPKAATGAFLAGTDVAMPARTRSEPAKYPDRAAADGIAGLVIVETTIDGQGRVRKAEVAQSVRQLDAAALDAVKRSRFAPSVVNGQVVEVLAYLPIKFGPSTSLWASDFLELGRFYYQRGLWRHAAATLDNAGETARKDAERFGRIHDSDVPDQPAGLTWPRVLKETKPKYTSAAMKAKVTGIVEMRVLVDQFGEVGRVSIVKPLPMLNIPAEQAAMQWRFSAGKLDGQPISVIVWLVLEFRLH